MNQPAESVPTADAVISDRRWLVQSRQAKVPTSMRLGLVVMLDVLAEQPDEMLIVTDQERRHRRLTAGPKQKIHSASQNWTICARPRAKSAQPSVAPIRRLALPDCPGRDPIEL